jgi:hypothetical protein
MISRGFEPRLNATVLCPAKQRRNLHVFLDGHREKGSDDLKGSCDAELRHAKRRQVGDRFAIQTDIARCGFEIARDHAE